MSEKLKKLNRDSVKTIALIPMFIGHLSAYLLENKIIGTSLLQTFLASIAEMAPPVFFFFIADGYKYTRSKSKYAARLLIFAVITQIPFAILNGGKFFICSNFNVFFTLYWGLIAIILWESKLKLPLRIIGVLLIDAFTLYMQSEWMIFGVLIILWLHIFEDKPKVRFAGFAVFVTLMMYISCGFTIYALKTPLFLFGEFFLFMGYFLRTSCYNGEKGNHPVLSKWFFYVFYPAHLLVIYAVIKILG